MGNGIKGKDDNVKFFTIEFFGVSLIIFSLLSTLCLLFGQNFLFDVGREIQYFFLGVFGYFAYPFLIALIFVGLMLLLGKKPNFKKSKRKVILLLVFLFTTLCLLTAITNFQKPADLSNYLYNAFKSGRKGLGGVCAGGVLFSLFTYPLVKYLTFVGAVVVYLFVLLLLVVIAFDKKGKKAKENNQDAERNSNQTENLSNQRNDSYLNQNNYGEATASSYNGVQNNFGQPNGYQSQNNFGQQNGYQPQSNFGQPNGYQPQNNFGQPNGYQPQNNFADQNNYGQNNPSQPNREEAMRILFGNGYNNTYSNEYSRPFVEGNNGQGAFQNRASNNLNDMISSPISKTNPVPDFIFNEDNDGVEIEKQEKIIPSKIFDDYDSDSSLINDELNDDYNPLEENFEVNDEVVEQVDEEAVIQVEDSTPNVKEDKKDNRKIFENMPINYRYKAPPISIFKTIDTTSTKYELELFNLEIKNRILSTLKTFGVETDIANVYNGPAVSRFDVIIPQDVPMNKVVKLQNDINLRIAAKSEIRMIAPVPNTSYVGIEVPNNIQEFVSIKDIMTSNDFINAKPNTLTFALGKDVIGRPVCLDLADMPHVLVSGTTGSGKSVCLNTMILSLISKYGPNELRFVIVDPKRVDLEPFKVLPHMMFGDIIEDVPTTNAMLTWAVNEMEERYKVLQASRSKNIKDYNIKAKEKGQKIMPRIVIIIDEFADIMLQDKKGVGVKVCAIAQKARASGIHLVLAAQRPSADIIDGPIKSNLPSRLVFKASSWQDSMTSLGEMGAEKLLGKGDCLYKTTNMYAVDRVMGAFVSDEEMYDIIDYVVDNNECYFDLNNWEKIKASVSSSYSSGDAEISASSESSTETNNGLDSQHIKALKLGYDFGGVSISFLQRKLGVGYPKAGKIVDKLIEKGYLSPNLIKNKMQVILPREEFDKMFGEKNDEE